MILKSPFKFNSLSPVLFLLFVFLAVCPNVIFAQCDNKKTCDSCIRTKDCVWCKDPNFDDETLPRCTPRDKLLPQCGSYELVMSSKNIIRSLPTAQQSTTEKGRQISPQEINLELKVGHPVTVQLEYLDAKDKKLDLYYLMDLSSTMSDDRATVAAQSQDLSLKLKEVTSDVWFGFGSFVDKPMLPFASTAQLKPSREDKWKTEVVPPYSFKNHLKLTPDTIQFAEHVKNTKNSSNLDEPEASLEAIMQVLACESEIGWRNDSRKLLVMSSDGPFHIAGDGKLAGIVLPNDMECHLENGRYTHEKILDYPSIGQLNAKVKETQVNIIFAVTEKQQKLYNKLRERIDGSKVVTLTSDSSNVVQVIQEEYKKLTETLELNQEPEKTDGLKITYSYHCNGSKNHENHEYSQITKPKCSIQTQKTQIFNITLELLEHACTGQTSLGKKPIVIYPFALGDEKLILNIKAICDCPCTSKGVLPEKCNNFGNLTCGICACDEKHRGKTCLCEASKTSQADDSACIDKDTGLECSNHGKCVCGKCECERVDHKEVYDGNLCQYDRRKCQATTSSPVCSGHGSCKEERCNCDDGYEGKFCNCVSNNNDNCIEPGKGNTEKCNGRGECKCGDESPDKIIYKQCKCYDDQSFKGTYCHTCEGCSVEGAVCGDSSIESCISCLDKRKALEEIQKEKSIQNMAADVINDIGNHFTRTEIPTDCTQECTESQTSKNVKFQLSVVESFRDGESSIGSSSQEFVSCLYQNQDSCKIRYRYFYSTNDMNEKYLIAEVIPKISDDCPVTPWWIIGVVVGSILLIGILLLLIWKIVTHIHDTREYQRFEQEQKGTQWGVDDNPLYNGPTSQFINPLRNRRSQMPAAAVAQSSH